MARSRRRRLSSADNRLLRALALVAAVALSVIGAAVPRAAAEEPMELQLEVSINGQPTGMIGGFTLLPGGRLAATPAELRELGVKADDAQAGPGGLVALDALPGVTVRYDEARQAIDLAAGDQQREVKQLSARDAKGDLEISEATTGLAVNYGFFASGGTAGGWDDFDFSAFGFNGASLSLEAWGFSPWGILANYMVLRADDFETPEALRLDTYWQYADPESLVTYTVGDAITRGPAWSRAIRFGGAQVSRNFGLAPDLVTIPQPSASGSAAVPSTVDIYINNVRAHTQSVPAGPFVIANIPAVTGDGDVRMVVRDANGREITASPP